MSNTKIPDHSAGESPASKMAKINQVPTFSPKFKTLNRLTTTSFIQKITEEGSLFPGSQMVEGEPRSLYDFRKRRIKPKFLKGSCFKPKDSQMIDKSQRKADLKKINKIHEDSTKTDFIQPNKNYNNKKEDRVVAESNNRSGARDFLLPSIHDELTVHSKIPPSFHSSFGFSMNTKKLITKNAILEDGGFKTEENAK